MAESWFPVSQALGGLYGDTKFVDYAQLDAFTAEAFKGNPAIVCLLPTPRTKKWMQDVAAEFNAPMAAFLVRRPNPQNATTANTQDLNTQDTIYLERSPQIQSCIAMINCQSPAGANPSEFNVRFFTPIAEVDLCGHATLASAYLIFKSNLARGSHVLFHTDSTSVKVRKMMGSGDGDKGWQGRVELMFPIMPTSPISTNMEELLPRTLQGCKVISAYTTKDGRRLILELPSASDVEALEPCFEEILAGPGAVVVTGKGKEESGFDFVSRFFAPKYGVPEDPVCGTAHCALASLWAAKLRKESLLAYQASQRGGVLDLFVDNDSKCVLLRGTAVMVAAGVLLC